MESWVIFLIGFVVGFSFYFLFKNFLTQIPNNVSILSSITLFVFFAKYLSNGNNVKKEPATITIIVVLSIYFSPCFV